MQVTVHKLNNEYVKNEAARIKAEGDHTGDADLNFYEWKTGENNLRILPPWSAKGMVFKRVFTHFEIPPEKSVFKCMLTWPDKFESCLICDGLDRVQSLFPEMDLGRQRYTMHYYANVIDRDEEEKGVQVCRFTGSIYNWLVLQMDNPKIGDITDYEKGYDVVITKTVRPRKKGKGDQIKYSCSFIPNSCPLHESDEAVAKWLSTLFDLDRVFGPLDDDSIAEVQGAASRLITYYQRRARGTGGGASSVGDSGVASEDLPEQRREQPQRRQETPSGDSPAPGDTSPTDAQTPAENLSDLDPKKLPTCHASLEAPDAHPDGTFGFNPDMEKCLLCPHEMSCMDAKASKGL
jgi:hypothetical protein